jgi:hypothetical protein
MNVVIEIHYISSENKILQAGSFPLRRRTPEQVAFEFWSHIKKENPYECEIEKIICNGDQDITQLIKELEKQKTLKIMNEDNLPF